MMLPFCRLVWMRLLKKAAASRKMGTVPFLALGLLSMQSWMIDELIEAHLDE